MRLSTFPEGRAGSHLIRGGCGCDGGEMRQKRKGAGGGAGVWGWRGGGERLRGRMLGPGLPAGIRCPTLQPSHLGSVFRCSRPRPFPFTYCALSQTSPPPLASSLAVRWWLLHKWQEKLYFKVYSPKSLLTRSRILSLLRAFKDTLHVLCV